MTRRPLMALAAAGVLALMAVPAVAQAPSAAIAAALADAGRPDKDKAQDAARKPAELVAFSKLKPGDVAVDVWPGGGYWTRIFSVLVGPKGRVYAYVPAEIVEFKNKPLDAAKATAAEAGRSNVEVVSDPLANPPPAEFENKANVIWTFENYHDFHNPFMKGANVDAFNAGVFKMLKPGGYYVIVDHAAPAGSGLSNTNTTHRIDPATLRAEVEKAGFKFDGESKVLANPADARDKLVFDPAIRGATDRFAYRFVKPKA